MLSRGGLDFIVKRTVSTDLILAEVNIWKHILIQRWDRYPVRYSPGNESGLIIDFYPVRGVLLPLPPKLPLAQEG